MSDFPQPGCWLVTSTKIITCLKLSGSLTFVKALFLGRVLHPNFCSIFHEILGKDDLVGLVTAPWNLMIDSPKYSSVRRLWVSKVQKERLNHKLSKHTEIANTHMEILNRNMLRHVSLHKLHRFFFHGALSG